MKCPRCEHELGGGREAVAGISILVEGDEVIFSYFRCPKRSAFSAEGEFVPFTARSVLLSVGNVSFDSLSNPNYVWPVRGGQ